MSEGRRQTHGLTKTRDREVGGLDSTVLISIGMTISLISENIHTHNEKKKLQTALKVLTWACCGVKMWLASQDNADGGNCVVNIATSLSEAWFSLSISLYRKDGRGLWRPEVLTLQSADDRIDFRVRFSNDIDVKPEIVSVSL